MKTDDQDRDLIRAFGELSDEGSGSTATVEELMALRSDDDEPTSEELVDRAALDAAEARLLLDAKQFPELEPSAEEQSAIAAFSAGDGWRALRGQLAEEGMVSPAETVSAVATVPTVETLPPAAIEPPAEPRSWPQWWALAATLVIGVALGVVLPRNGPPPVVVNPAVIEWPSGVARSSGQEPWQIQWSPGGLTLVIDVAEYAPGEGPFAVQLSPEKGSAETLIAEVADDRHDDTVRVTWTRPPSPGLYRLELRRGARALDTEWVKLIN